MEALRARLVDQGWLRPGILARGGGAIPVGGPRPRIWREGVVLCGDAAGLTHPVTGAGIPQALASGRLAGRAAAALAGGGAAAAGAGESYAAALAGAYGRYLARGMAARVPGRAGMTRISLASWRALGRPGPRDRGGRTCRLISTLLARAGELSWSRHGRTLDCFLPGSSWPMDCGDATRR